MAGNGELDKEIVGFTKPRKFLWFRLKPKPIYAKKSPEPKTQPQPQPQQQQQAQATQSPAQQRPSPQQQRPQPQPQPQQGPAVQKRSLFSFPKPIQRQQQKAVPKKRAEVEQLPRRSPLDNYVNGILIKHRNLPAALKEHGSKETPAIFVTRIVLISAGAAVGLALVLGLMLLTLVGAAAAVLLAAVMLIATYMTVFNTMLSAPTRTKGVSGRDIERDVLFAARDMIISMRSGLPIYNAIATVSTGYGAASKEFAKIIDLVQVGTPIEQAMEQVSEQSGSKTFKRIMLQASISIKAGADVIESLQEMINDVSQERVIELRRYGQRLNAIAMFYMLFGVIFPSMGIAVASIMTTFISFISITNTTLIFVLVGILFLQFVFLNLMSQSRPVFAA